MGWGVCGFEWGGGGGVGGVCVLGSFGLLFCVWYFGLRFPLGTCALGLAHLVYVQGKKIF
jgi:hypothetical protein